MENKELIEQLANLAHQQWSGWMEYLFSKCTQNIDGSATIPKWAVERWRRQAETKYIDLPEEEKESDREEAKKVLHELENKKAKQKQIRQAISRAMYG